MSKKIFKKEPCGQHMKVKCVGPPKCDDVDLEIYFQIADECPPDFCPQDNDICISKFYFAIADTTSNPTRAIVDVTGPMRHNIV